MPLLTLSKKHWKFMFVMALKKTRVEQWTVDYQQLSFSLFFFFSSLSSFTKSCLLTCRVRRKVVKRPSRSQTICRWKHLYYKQTASGWHQGSLAPPILLHFKTTWSFSSVGEKQVESKSICSNVITTLCCAPDAKRKNSK